MCQIVLDDERVNCGRRSVRGEGSKDGVHGLSAQSFDRLPEMVAEVPDALRLSVRIVVSDFKRTAHLFLIPDVVVFVRQRDAHGGRVGRGFVVGGMTAIDDR